MHVDVDQLGRHVEPQEADRLPAGEQQAAIGFAERVLQRAVADRPAVEKQVLHPAGGAAVHRIGDEAGERDAVARRFRSRSGRRPAPGRRTRRSRWRTSSTGGRSCTSRPLCVSVKWTCGWASASRVRASVVWPISVCVERRNLCRTGVLKNRLRTSIVVPTGQPTGATGCGWPPTTSSSAPLVGVGRAAAKDEPADFGDRRQRFAAEAERADAEQIVGLADLAGGMAGHGERQLVGRDAAAVVGDADQLAAPLLHRDVDPRRAGVDRVLQQLLDDARRPLDHLAGGDLVDDARRELVDGGHGRVIRRQYDRCGQARTLT